MAKKFIRFGFALAFVVGLYGCKGSKNMATTKTDDTTTREITDATVAKEAAPTVEETMPVGEPLPFDPDTRVGKLDNGLTYYIRQNAKPENFAELRLAINVGSLQENEDQQGLAHFLEHMCFNGTKNFPKSDLVDYLESIGTKFGAHLNAYTAFDETVYMLKIPTDDADKFDKGLQILEDWAHNVSLDAEEIEKERGVVISEWRTRLGAQERMQQETLPVIFYGSRYPERIPIGKTEILESFKPETLEQFYKDWYRPELMAVVAVGDFDMDEVEAQIKEKFGRIPKSGGNTRDRGVYPLADHEDTKVVIAADEEFPFNVVQLMTKHPHVNVQDMAGYRKSVSRQLGLNMLQNRLTELTQSADAPFNAAFGGYGGFGARSTDAMQMGALIAPGGFVKGLKALVTEQERAARFGFTESELERTKKSRLASLEKGFKEKDKTESANLIDSYVQNFLAGSPVMGIGNSLKINQALLPQISLEEVNEVFKSMFRDDNQVVVVMASKKEGNEIPAEAALKAAIKEAKAQELEAYTDEVSDAPLVAEQPAPGRIMMESSWDEVGATKFRLSNGATVILKPTNFKDDEIIMNAFSWGGNSLYSDEEYMSASFADAIVSNSGLGEYDELQLGKYMADKVARVSPYIGELTEGLSGSSSVKDLETMFQLVHLYFTKPRKDTTAFEAMMAQQKAFIGNMLSSPQSYFSNEVNKIMTNDHPRSGFPTIEKLNQVDLEDAFRIYQDRFANASDFTFVFVGNFEVEQMKPLIKNYIASLPRIKRKENFKDVGREQMRGVVEKEFRKGREPQSQVRLVYTGDFEYTEQQSFHLDAAIDVLSIMMRESMREDKGGVYGVGVGGGASRRPRQQYSVNVNFTCDPKDAEDLIATALADVKNLQDNGPSEKNMQKIKEIMRKETQDNMKKNGFWLSGLSSVVRNKKEPASLLDMNEKIDALTADDVQKAAKKYFNGSNFGKFILYPEE
ncbi:MAG: insulinase family protein [Bacteroidia bacterium]|nr:insulinase family protein [Bacteroidia bacterium]